MGKQRPWGVSYSRRRFIQAAGVTGLTSTAGCVGDTADGQAPTIAILAPGSLQNALANGLRPAVDIPVQIEAHGSATVARMIAEGQRDPDIVSVADVALFENQLTPSWYSIFASNSLVLIYNPETDAGQRLAAAGPENWYQPLADGTVSLGRTDPDQDPLGYRTLFMIELASRHYDGTSNLRDQILQQDQVYPETGLLSQFETGSIDAAIGYRNMAVERGYEYIELPDQINLSNPRYVDDWYATTSYTLPSGQQIQGGLISYGSTIRHMSDAAVAVFDAHTTGSYLGNHGFILREQFPAYTGDIPQPVRETTTDTSGDNQSQLTHSQMELSPYLTEITVLI
jgi:molybdate/tungstate transport system substrate-binding protein